MSTLLLDKLLEPDSIVVIGASARENSPGLKLSRNLIEGNFSGDLYLVNPRYQQVLEHTCYKNVKSLPHTPDLAIILTPPGILRRVLIQCSSKGIKVAIVMSGTTQPQALHRYAQRLGMRLMGPYCAGLIRPHIGLNATFSANRIQKGNLAIVSQSAALGAALVDWAESNNVGYSALLSTGQDTDIRLADLLDLLAEDWHTKAVIVYVDRVEASRSFLSALSATARIKPVVLMHATYIGASYCDALIRTGELNSSDSVFETAINRAGVVRIRTFENLYAAAKILSSGLRVKGKRLVVVSNANAPALMALHRIGIKQFEVPRLKNSLLSKIYNKRKVQFTGNNPILLRDPDNLAELYLQTISKLQEQASQDAILIIFVPDSRNDANEIAKSVIKCLPSSTPLLTCWMGDASVTEARELLSKAGVPTFRTPEAATDGFDFLHRYFVSQQQLLQLPNPTSRSTRADLESARELVRNELEENTRVLDPASAHRLLKQFDIPVLPASHARHIDEAVLMARQIGFPIAMKLVSQNIGYKSSIIDTQLDIRNELDVRSAFTNIASSLTSVRPEATFDGVMLEPIYQPFNARHLAISVSRDAVFGPVISVGIGGELTAMHQQRSVHLPPLNSFLINELLSRQQIKTYLGAFRQSKAVDDRPLANVLRRVSELACELPEVFSLDINPLILSDQGAMAMDVHVVIQRLQSAGRYQHLAIHPYPWQWVIDIELKNGKQAQLRPIRPTDASSLQSMVREMSAESRYFRFMHAVNELSPHMIAQFTKLDYDRQMAFVATFEKLNGTPHSDHQGQVVGQVVGVSRYIISSNRQSAEFAVSVADSCTGLGLATHLMRVLISHARSQDIEFLFGDVLRNNIPMQALMKSMGFKAEPAADDPDVLRYTFELNRHPL